MGAVIPSGNFARLLLMLLLVGLGATAFCQPVFTTWSAQNVYFDCSDASGQKSPCQLVGTVTTSSFNPTYNDIEVFSTHLLLITPQGSFPLNFSDCNSEVRNPSCGPYGVHVTSYDQSLESPFTLYTYVGGYYYYPGEYATVRLGGVDFNDPTHPVRIDACPPGLSCSNLGSVLYVHNVVSECSAGNPGGCRLPAEGSWGGGAVLLPGGYFIGQTAPPPTVQQLAALSLDAYNDTPTGAGEYQVIQTRAGDFSFRVAAYANDDGSQIVIAPRGTSKADEKTDAYTWMADEGFAASVPNVVTNGHLIQLGGFLQDVAQANPNSQITLTGYSLGGGLAQVVGAFAHIQTVTFLSPGGNTFIPFVQNSLGPLAQLKILSPSSAIYDYRQTGDLISLVGTQVGTSITVDNPLLADISAGPIFVGSVGLGWGVYHSLALLSSTLESQPTAPGILGPKEQFGAPDSGLLQSAVVFGSAVNAAWNFSHPDIHSGKLLQFDPRPGYGYSFSAAPGSPLFASLVLPIDNGVSGWSLTSYLNGTALGTQFAQDGHFNFAFGIDRLDFHPVDEHGNTIYYPDPFFLGLTFDRDGDFNGTLQVVTEPVAGAPTLQSVVSRKIHGGAGTFDLALSPVTTNPTTEPRFGPAHTLVFTFDMPVTGGTATVTEGAATVGVVTFNGNEIIVPLTNVADQQYLTVNLSDVSSSIGGGGGTASIRLGLLAGDVNQNRVVTVSDLAQMNAQVAQTVTSANYLKDVNASGTLTVADKGLTNGRLTKALAAP